MKHLKYITAIIAIGIFFSFQQNEKIIGKWLINSYEISNNKLEKNPKKWIKFSNDGKLEGGSSTNQIRKTGTWKIDNTNKKLIISSDKKSNEDGTYSFEFLDPNHLTLTKDSIKVYKTKTF